MQLHRPPRVLGFVVFAVITMMAGLSVQAGMIGTEQVLKQQRVQTDIQKIQTALAREDVKQLLLTHGVTAQQAQLRIDQLTDQEIHQLANRFDELPAPAGVGVLLLLSGPAMLLLEYIGMTDLTTAF